MITRVADVLRRGERFVVLSHVDPDGDALGTALGLAGVLRAMGKRATVGVPGGTPELYAFLPGADDVIAGPDEAPDDVDAIVSVDATSPARLGDFARLLEGGPPVVNIDHHIDNTRFGDPAWIDPSACATSLMVAELARSEDMPLPEVAAIPLYVGILTDTGRFTYANTDERALSVAGALVRAGADPHRIAAEVYEKNSVGALRLLGAVLETLELRDEGRIACLHMTRDTVRKCGARDEDADGFSTHARALVGVQVGVFLRESADGSIKVSFRSNEGVDVHGVASRFGGGGHPRASGARVPGPLEKAKEDVLRAVGEHLRTGNA